MAVKAIPDGYHTITPHLIVEGALGRSVAVGWAWSTRLRTTFYHLLQLFRHIKGCLPSIFRVFRHAPLNDVVQILVNGTVDFSHASFTDLLKDFVMADGGSDHKTPPRCAMQWVSMLNLQGVKGQSK